MPPLVRPTRPRQPWRRVASTTWRTAAPAAKPPNPNASRGASPRAPSSTDTTTAAVPAHAGQNRRCDSSSVEALRQGSTGATAMRNSSVRPMGMVMRSKYGLPTDSCSSLAASTSSGNTVPSSTTNANPANSTLLARNAPSREAGESMRPGDRSRSARQPIRPSVTATVSPKKASSHTPIEPSVKACTEAMTPERVRKVPRMSANVAHHAGSDRRCAAILHMTEWRKAFRSARQQQASRRVPPVATQLRTCAQQREPCRRSGSPGEHCPRRVSSPAIDNPDVTGRDREANGRETDSSQGLGGGASRAGCYAAGVGPGPRSRGGSKVRERVGGTAVAREDRDHSSFIDRPRGSSSRLRNLCTTSAMSRWHQPPSRIDPSSAATGATL